MKNRRKKEGKREIEQKYLTKQKEDRNALISSCDDAMVFVKKKDLDNLIKNNVYA